VLPLLDLSVAEVDGMLDDLDAAGLIRRYTDEQGRPVALVVGFLDHQKGMRYDRESPSKYGPIPTNAGGLPTNAGGLPTNAGGVRHKVRQDKPKIKVKPTRAGARGLPPPKFVSKGTREKAEEEARKKADQISAIAREIGKFRSLENIGPPDHVLDFAQALHGLMNAPGRAPTSLESAIFAITQAAGSVSRDQPPEKVRRLVRAYVERAKPAGELEHEKTQRRERAAFAAEERGRHDRQQTPREAQERPAPAAPSETVISAGAILKTLKGAMGAN
jgi:hypothetical protein